MDSSEINAIENASSIVTNEATDSGRHSRAVRREENKIMDEKMDAMQKRMEMKMKLLLENNNSNLRALVGYILELQSKITNVD